MDSLRGECEAGRNVNCMGSFALDQSGLMASEGAESFSGFTTPWNIPVLDANTRGFR
jgi:hypothetical protein